MNAEDFIPYLGKTDDHADIRQLLTALGIQKIPKIKRGDTDARGEAPSQGIELVFEPVNDKKSSLLVLNSVQLYGNTQGGTVTPYSGTLPFGLQFSDSRKDARMKAGKPTFADEDMDNDSWDFETHTMVLEYGGDATNIAVVQMMVPFEPADE